MLNVIGIVVTKGEYQGNNYHNANLHCINEKPTTEGFEGVSVEVVKVKYDLFCETGINVGDNINPMYDKYGRIVSL